MKKKYLIFLVLSFCLFSSCSTMLEIITGNYKCAYPNCNDRAAYSQKEAAGGRSGTPEEAKKEQRFRNGHVIFLFSGTKVTPHRVFVKGRFTLRVKNLLCSLRSCGIFYPSPLTNTLCFAGRCLGKKKKHW
jgi:hypothetical protein